MNLLDILVIAVYLVVVTTVGLRLGACGGDVDTFSVNRRRTGFWLIVASLVANNAGAATFLVGASTGYDTGISYGLSSVLIVTLGYALLARFAPSIKKQADTLKLTTMGQFVRERYGSKRCQFAVAVVIILAYLLFLATQLSGFTLIMHYWTGIRMELCLGTAALVTVALTAWTGIRGDFYTDAIHLIVMILGLVIALPAAMLAGTSPLPELSALPVKAFDPFAFKGEVFFLGSVVFGVILLFSSMDLWQHIYALHDETENHRRSRRAFVLAAVINLPLLVVPVALGLLMRSRHPGLTADQILPAMIMQYLPAGLRGLAVAAILAAIISTANSMILVVSFTLDFDLLGHRPASAKSILWRARAIALIIGLVGALLALLLKTLASQLVAAFQIVAVLSPTLLTALVLERPSERAAFWSTVIGTVVTVAYMVLIDWYTGFVPGLVIGILVFVYLSSMDRKQAVA